MEWDEASHFPMEIMPKLAEMGLLGVIFPEQYGGAGLGYIEYALAIEELSRVDGSVGLIVAAHNSLCSNHIFKFGTEGQKKKYLVPLASGKAIGAWSLTEPEAGSDAGGTRTTAVRDGKHWVLNGSKTFTTNGHYADFCVAMAVTDKSKASHGISAFVLEKGMAGFKPGKKENKLGMRASDTSEVIFTDCGVGIGDGAGSPGSGDEVREAAETVWAGDQRVSGGAIQAGGHGDASGSGTAVGLSGGVDGGQKRCAIYEGIEHGEIVCQRSGGACGERVRADSRRIWVHQGLPCGEVLPRREALHDRRGNQRNSEVGDC